MERRLQEVSEEDDSACADDGGSVDHAQAVVSEGGSDPISGSGECDADGESFREELDLSAFSPRLRARFEKQAEEETKLSREQKEELAKLLPFDRMMFDELFANHAFSGVGGVIEAFAVAADMDELKRVMEWTYERNVDHWFFGCGGKVLVRDAGVAGLSIKLGDGFNFIRVEGETEEDIFVTVGASTTVPEFTGFCAENGFVGMEDLFETGGSIAGCIVLNAKVGEGMICDFVEEVTIVNKDRRELSLRGKSLRFDENRLKIPRTAAIVRVIFKLKKGDKAEVASRIDAIATKLSNRNSHGIGFIGGVFADLGKTTADMLIGDAGLMGIRIGSARVSRTDANAIVNEGKATARDVTVLMNLIRDRVKQQTGIVLEPKISIVGKRESA